MSDSDPSYILQYSELSHIAQRIVSKFARDKYVFAKAGLLELESNLENLGTTKGTCGDITSAHHDNTSHANLQLRDPKINKNRGRAKGRMKSALESKRGKKKVQSRKQG